MNARFLAAFAAFLLWSSAALGQTTGVWPMANEPCPAILHPHHSPDLPQVRALLTQAQTALDALPETAGEADRASVRALFQRAHEISGGLLEAIYSHAVALRRLRALEPARRVFACLRGDESVEQQAVFAAMPEWLRIGTVSAIGAIDRDIEAARVAAQSRPGPSVSLVGPGPRIVGPVIGGPRIGGPPVARTPHPRSAALRTAGQVTTGVGAALTIAGVVLTAMCYADVYGDVAYAHEANGGALHGWSTARVDRTQRICDAGGVLLVAGPLITGAGVVGWRYGGQQVTDPPPPAPRGTNGIPIISLAPTPGGGQASATWRF
jgi:hypothetical protein